MILVLITSTGEPTTVAQNPAKEELTIWQGTPSSIILYFNKVYLVWSKLDNSAALIMAFLIILGPTPVQKDNNPSYFKILE